MSNISIYSRIYSKRKACDTDNLSPFEADRTSEINHMDSIDQINQKKMPLVAIVEPN